MVYSRGTALRRAAGPVAAPDLAAIQARCHAGPGRPELTGAECYAAFQERGVAYGPSHRVVERIAAGSDEALAWLVLPSGAYSEARGEDGPWTLHPSMLDAALQSAAGLVLAAGRLPASPLVPFTVGALEVHGETGSAMWAHVRRAAPGSGETFDIDLCDEAGRLRVRIEHARAAAVSDAVQRQWRDYCEADSSAF